MAADTTYFLKILGGEGLANGGGGAPSGGGGGGDQQKSFKAIRNELEKGNSGAKKGLGATLGIKFGVASLLKQSQVFTGFVGTIFQLMGALVDVILAPFLPILIPGIRLIASLIPYVSKYAQAVYDFLDRVIFQWFRSFPLSDRVKEGAKKALSAILVGVVFMKFTGLWNTFKSLVSTFIGKPLWAAAKTAAGVVGDIFRLFGASVLDDIAKGAGKALTGAWDATGGKIVTGVKAAWDGIVRAAWTDGIKPIITGIKTRFSTILDDLIRRLWTNGLKASFVTPLLTRLTGVADFISAPFSKLWSTITGNVATSGDGIIARGLTALKNIPGVKTLFAIGTHITDYMKVLADWFMNLPFLRVIKDLPGNILNFITTDFPRMIAGLPIVGALAKFLEASLKKLLEKAGGLFGKAFGAVKGAVGAVKGKVGGVVGDIVPKLGGAFSPKNLLKAAKGLKAIPVLGAVAEAGFGAYATYKDYKKYGYKAAAGRLGLTLANVGTALFDPTGLASAGGSIASNIAMDVAYRKMLDPKDSWKRDNPTIWVEEEDPMTGEMHWRKRTSAQQDAYKASRNGAGVRSVSMDE